MIIEHASVSRLALFRDCSLRYRYKYHDKVESPLTDPSFLYLGKLVHGAFERFVQQGLTFKDGMEAARRMILEEAKTGDYDGKVSAEDMKRIPNHLVSFMSLQRDIEQSFPQRREVVEWSLPRDPIANGTDHDGIARDVEMSGFVDRLVFHENGAMVIDYKTSRGKNQKSISQAMTDPQLMTYAYFVSKTFDVPAERITTMLYYLENGKKVPATFSAAALEEHMQSVREQSLHILGMQPEETKANLSGYCRFCEYRGICPARLKVDRMLGD